MKKRNIVFISLAVIFLVLIIGAVAIYNALPGFLANTFLYPPDQPFPKNPSDYGYDYRDVNFPASDGLTLSGWVLNEKADKVIIMTHFGYLANRYGYQTKHAGLIKPYDKEIEFIKVAGKLVEAGYAVLMYDLRNHGVSGKTEKAVGTGGIEEARDILGAVEFITEHETTKGKPVGLLSYCMGANATSIAFGKNPDLFNSSNVRALVAMQPLTNALFLETMKFPKKIFDAVASRFKSVSGYDFHAPVVENVPSITVPTLLCQLKKDPNINMDFINNIY
ncbi:MAG: alpha/beta hydrolase, partial [Desulfobacterales bacterium]|nr:alpha/beta hydrolase [Desulfobacterales bacterium]